MRATKNNVDDIAQEKKQEIINYCYGIMRGVNIHYLKKMKIRLNLFIEVLYDVSVNNFLNFEDYTISPQDLKNVYAYTKNIESILDKFMNGNIELLAIDEKDQFHFKIMRLIGQ